ncbi:MAG TPA: peptidoglycan-binding protein [Ilumatobacter sp.]|nr:peptidoglycan-binding protein [Ilumatobacter sp.]
MADPILKRGDSGQYVEQLQQRLEQVGYSVDGVDGDYGRKTVEAVQAFQAAYHLDPSGEVDETTWNLLFSLEDASLTTHDPSAGATAEALLDMALHQVNDRYVLGTNADEQNPDEDEFDCAELISWSCAQLGVTFPDYSVSQIDACAKAGLEISVSEASSIRGALLFRAAGHNGSQYNHVALSLGSGNDTIEAMGKNYGVAVGEIGNRFTRAAYIPGITY